MLHADSRLHTTQKETFARGHAHPPAPNPTPKFTRYQIVYNISVARMTPPLCARVLPHRLMRDTRPTYMCVGCHTPHTQALEAGAAPALSRLLGARHKTVLLRALGATACVASACSRGSGGSIGDSGRPAGGSGSSSGGAAFSLVAAGVVPKLAAILASPLHSDVLATACRAMSEVCRPCPTAKAQAVTAGVPARLAHLVARAGSLHACAAAAGCIEALCSGGGGSGGEDTSVDVAAEAAARDAFVRSGGLAPLLALLGRCMVHWGGVLPLLLGFATPALVACCTFMAPARIRQLLQQGRNPSCPVIGTA